jgi:hypothetical protein
MKTQGVDFHVASEEEIDQSWEEAISVVEGVSEGLLFPRKCMTKWYSAHHSVTLPLRCLAAPPHGPLTSVF